MRRMFAAAFMATVLMTSAMPVSAGIGAGGFVGSMVVGAVAGSCTKGGPHTDPSGVGLRLPVPGQSLNRHWRITTDHFSWLDTNGHVVVDGALALCGKLTGVAGIGAACGWHKGYAGVGTIYANRNQTVPVMGVNDAG